jgi:hypothetical protein
MTTENSVCWKLDLRDGEINAGYKLQRYDSSEQPTELTKMQ